MGCWCPKFLLNTLCLSHGPGCRTVCLKFVLWIGTKFVTGCLAIWFILLLLTKRSQIPRYYEKLEPLCRALIPKCIEPFKENKKEALPMWEKWLSWQANAMNSQCGPLGLEGLVSVSTHRVCEGLLRAMNHRVELGWHLSCILSEMTMPISGYWLSGSAALRRLPEAKFKHCKRASHSELGIFVQEEHRVLSDENSGILTFETPFWGEVNLNSPGRETLHVSVNIQ